MGAGAYQRVVNAGYVRQAILSMTVAAAETNVVATSPAYYLFPGAAGLTVSARFTYAAGGTSAKYYIQTSIDGGTNWIDIMCFAFATATALKVSSVHTAIAVAAGSAITDGTLADNTILTGVLGELIRVKRLSTGTYTGATTILIDAQGR